MFRVFTGDHVVARVLFLEPNMITSAPRDDQLPCLLTETEDEQGNNTVLAVFERSQDVFDRLAVLAARVGGLLPLWPVSHSAVAIWQGRQWPMITSVERGVNTLKPADGWRLGPFFDPRPLPCKDIFILRDPWWKNVLMLDADGRVREDHCGTGCLARVKCTITGGPREIASASLSIVDSNAERIESRCAFFRSAAAGVDGIDELGGGDFRIQNEQRNKYREVWGDLVRRALVNRSTLGDLGFWVTDRWTVFDGRLGLSEWRGRESRFALAVAMDDIVAKNGLREDRRVVAKRVRELGVASIVSQTQWREPPSIADFVFTNRQVTSSMMAMKSAAALRQETKDQRKAFKRSACVKCVYACKGTPWDMEPCTVTIDTIVDEAKAIGRDALCSWVASFAVMGRKATKSRRMFIGWGPESLPAAGRPITIVRRSLSVPFRVVDRVPLVKYMADAGSGLVDRYGIALHNANALIDVDLARVYWALKQLCDYGKWSGDRATFYSGTRTTRTGKERDKWCRNDVLAIVIDDELKRICVMSDTKAKDDGGGGISGPKGDPIKREDRPRFSTSYSFPFFGDILQITGRPLGSKRSSTNGYGRL